MYLSCSYMITNSLVSTHDFIWCHFLVPEGASDDFPHFHTFEKELFNFLIFIFVVTELHDAFFPFIP